MSDSVPLPADDVLIRNWFRNVKNTAYEARPLWAVVKDSFAIGKGSAHKLCISLGRNPDEEIPGLVVDGLCGVCRTFFCTECEELSHRGEGSGTECPICKELEDVP